MSNHPFGLSVIAAAVFFACHSTQAVAETVTESIDKANNQLDIAQSSQHQFHYRQSDIAIGLTGATVLPGASQANLELMHRGVSDGVAIMQDGIFFSPAPYSGQNLVLQPNLQQQQSATLSGMTSVVDGSEAAFGKLEYQSVAISDKKYAGKFNVEVNDDADYGGGVVVSGTTKEYGMLLALDYQSASDEVGYALDKDADTKQTDIMFKIDADSLPGARNKQTTEFSYQYSSQETQQGTLGLTNTDFELVPNQRYAAANIDFTDGERQRYVLAHKLLLSKTSTVATDFYYQTYSQKTADMMFVDGQTISNALLSEIAAFEITPTTDGMNLGALTKDNDFAGFGVQTKGVSMYGEHQVTYSARYHTDKAEMELGNQDWMWGQDLSLTSASDNAAIAVYKDDASSFLSAVDTKLNYGQLSVNLGLGYEHVSVSRSVSDDYDLVSADFSDDGWMPSVEVAYTAGGWSAAAQAKQAWTAASAGNLEQKAQEALQYQLAVAYKQDSLALAMTAYMHDYDNQHVGCMFGMVCGVEQITLQENIEDVTVNGLDFSVEYGLMFDSFSIPLKAKYQYTQAESDVGYCSSYNGCFDGDTQLPWVPKQQLTLSSGVVVGDLSVIAQALYQSELEYAGNLNDFGAVDSQWKVDLAASYQVTQQHEVYLRVENLFDETLVASRTVAGRQAQSEMTTYIGYQARF
ncbi:TonB-dependent receptor [Shewanella inventionis]|uniref:TonB-dependent receptor n=1 Tax=Shewanella inventionis TaxID=1738770 RepID=A0ABQ1JJQ7_9GAMM|nr:TonB-dependent receptor [Shewanella inventionis]MCL1159363.1 TonB-dependent receptor [Shewanella inventionis]UAL44636.1 TonB-dependent receptor [Shewanella inventionis]GGB68000.1 TonB-dependent receptor [Shewanella inventionis]